jgi:hypothetical protein
MIARILFVLSLVALAVPAQAADGAQVPEGSSVTLFAIGLAGLILGRRLSSSKNDKS